MPEARSICVIVPRVWRWPRRTYGPNSKPSHNTIRSSGPGVHRVAAGQGAEKASPPSPTSCASPPSARGLRGLRKHLGDRTDALLDAVEQLLMQRHRASSAIEGFNAALRPYLYVHKGVTQGFLELFRAYFNLRPRRWGRHKGTSAHQSGKPVEDWLAVLGYPPSTALT